MAVFSHQLNQNITFGSMQQTEMITKPQRITILLFPLPTSNHFDLHGSSTIKNT